MVRSELLHRTRLVAEVGCVGWLEEKWLTRGRSAGCVRVNGRAHGARGRVLVGRGSLGRRSVEGALFGWRVGHFLACLRIDYGDSRASSLLRNLHRHRMRRRHRLQAGWSSGYVGSTPRRHVRHSMRRHEGRRRSHGLWRDLRSHRLAMRWRDALWRRASWLRTRRLLTRVCGRLVERTARRRYAALTGRSVGMSRAHSRRLHTRWRRVEGCIGSRRLQRS